MGKNPAMAERDASISFQVPGKEAGFYRLVVKLIRRGEPQIDPPKMTLLMRANGRVIGSAKFFVGIPVAVDGWLNLNANDALSNVEITFDIEGDDKNDDIYDLIGTEVATIHLKKIEIDPLSLEYEFHDEGNGNELLGSGWYKPEIGGTWSKSENADLAILVEQSPFDRSLDIALLGMTFGAGAEGGGELVFRALVDGQFLTHVLNLDHDAEFEVSIPPLRIPANYSEPIILGVGKRTFKPSEMLEGNGDSRDLGYHIKKIIISSGQLSI
jgi:hypothetical protein